jgi:hypothetical protein
MTQSSGSILIGLMLKAKPLFGYAVVMMIALIAGIYIGAALHINRLQQQYDTAENWNTSLNQELGDEEAKRVSLEMQFGKALSTQASPMVAPIRLVSSRDDNHGGALTVGPEKLMIELDLEKPITNHSEYQVTIVNDKGQLISESGCLESVNKDLATTVHYWLAASSVQPGDYKVNLFGTNSKGMRDEIATYPVRLVKSQ